MGGDGSLAPSPLAGEGRDEGDTAAASASRPGSHLVVIPLKIAYVTPTSVIPAEAKIHSPNPVGRCHFHLPWCRWQPAWPIAMKTAVHRPTPSYRRKPVSSPRPLDSSLHRSDGEPTTFIPLYGLRKAIVILRSAATKNLQPLARRPSPDDTRRFLTSLALRSE